MPSYAVALIIVVGRYLKPGSRRCIDHDQGAASIPDGKIPIDRKYIAVTLSAKLII